MTHQTHTGGNTMLDLRNLAIPFIMLLGKQGLQGSSTKKTDKADKASKASKADKAVKASKASKASKADKADKVGGGDCGCNKLSGGDNNRVNYERLTQNFREISSQLNSMLTSMV